MALGTSDVILGQKIAFMIYTSYYYTSKYVLIGLKLSPICALVKLLEHKFYSPVIFHFENVGRKTLTQLV